MMFLCGRRSEEVRLLLKKSKDRLHLFGTSVGFVIVLKMKRRAQLLRTQFKEARGFFPKGAGFLPQKKRGPSFVANQTSCGGAKVRVGGPGDLRGHQRSCGGTNALVEAPAYL